MVKFFSKKYRCVDCGNEQYTNKHCYPCEGNSFEKIVLERERSYTIECMTCEKELGESDEQVTTAKCRECYYKIN